MISIAKLLLGLLHEQNLRVFFINVSKMQFFIELASNLINKIIIMNMICLEAIGKL